MEFIAPALGFIGLAYGMYRAGMFEWLPLDTWIDAMSGPTRLLPVTMEERKIALEKKRATRVGIGGGYTVTSGSITLTGSVAGRAEGVANEN